MPGRSDDGLAQLWMLGRLRSARAPRRPDPPDAIACGRVWRSKEAAYPLRKVSGRTCLAYRTPQCGGAGDCHCHAQPVPELGHRRQPAGAGPLCGRPAFAGVPRAQSRALHHQGFPPPCVPAAPFTDSSGTMWATSLRGWRRPPLVRWRTPSGKASRCGVYVVGHCRPLAQDVAGAVGPRGCVSSRRLCCGMGGNGCARGALPWPQLLVRAPGQTYVPLACQPERVGAQS